MHKFYKSEKILMFVICSTFGEIKTLRLPQKLSGAGTHRGFAFVDFLTKQDAKVRSLYCAGIKDVLQLSSTKKCRIIIITIKILIIIQSTPLIWTLRGPYKVSVLTECPYQMG